MAVRSLGGYEQAWSVSWVSPKTMMRSSSAGSTDRQIDMQMLIEEHRCDPYADHDLLDFLLTI